MENINASADADEVLKALSHPLRRWIVCEVAEQSTIELDRLTQRCVESRAGGTGDDYHQVAISLRHVHLPKLENAGLIRYGYDVGEVALTETANDALDVTLDELESIRTEFPRECCP